MFPVILTDVSWVNKVSVVLNTSVSFTNALIWVFCNENCVVSLASAASVSHLTAAIFVILLPSIF